MTQPGQRPGRCRCIRWAVYILTALVLVGIPVSIWLPQTLVIDHTNASGNQRVIFAELSGARINAEQSPMLPPTGTKGLHLQRIGASIVGTRAPWWAMPSYQYFPTPAPAGAPPGIPAWFVEVPLIYPAMVLAGLSWLFIRAGRRHTAPGHCPGCDYDLSGTDAPICPECGATYA